MLEEQRTNCMVHWVYHVPNGRHNDGIIYRFIGLTSEKAMAPHSSTLAWKIPWMEEPGGLQSMGSLRSDTTEWLHFHFSLSCIGEGNGNLLQCSCLENPRDGGAWWAAVYGVTQSRTRLKRFSSNSRTYFPGFQGFIRFSDKPWCENHIFPYKIIYGLTNLKVRLFKIPGCMLLFAHEFTVSSSLICPWSLTLPTPSCCLSLAHTVSHSWNTLLAIVLTT